MAGKVKQNVEPQPGRARRCDGDLTSVHLDQATRDGQPQADAAIAACGGIFCLVEFIEDGLLFSGGDAQARVVDAHAHLAVIRCGAQHDLTVRREFHRIAQQVEQHLSEPGAVSPDRRQSPGDLRPPRQSLVLCHLFAHDPDPPQQFGQVKWLAGQAQLPDLAAGRDRARRGSGDPGAGRCHRSVPGSRLVSH